MTLDLDGQQTISSTRTNSPAPNKDTGSASFLSNQFGKKSGKKSDKKRPATTTLPKGGGVAEESNKDGGGNRNDRGLLGEGQGYSQWNDDEV